MAAFDVRRVDARSGRSTMIPFMKMDFMNSSGLVFLNHQAPVYPCNIIDYWTPDDAMWAQAARKVCSSSNELTMLCTQD